MTTRATPLDRTELCCILSMEAQPGRRSLNPDSIRQQALTRCALLIKPPSSSAVCIRWDDQRTAAQTLAELYSAAIPTHSGIASSPPAPLLFGRLGELR